MPILKVDPYGLTEMVAYGRLITMAVNVIPRGRIIYAASGSAPGGAKLIGTGLAVAIAAALGTAGCVLELIGDSKDGLTWDENAKYKTCLLTDE